MERRQEENWHIVGVISESVAKYIGMKGRTPVWISEKTTNHIAEKHKRELAQLGTTALAFVRKVVVNFNNVYKQVDGTVVLAIEGTIKSMVVYIKLELASDNYWRVKSAHLRDSVDLDNYTQLWSKAVNRKKPVKRR